ncbi:hypothetical protein M947_03985 [Sulfurimonas hongkongensis]|uniref:Uncharacterized protein n=1 Tax=Sulfurimonas hongkongensis TaxID=1172190 RepID=T0JS56_9BACT|nr:hypothetical protein [Sulfurimonas hongkongensis]EQB39742.1 hypothetical protein M947_03985 [Sulfurimonas hongkongensis]
MEFLKKYKIVFFRVAGILMLLIGFVVHFWLTPKEAYTQNELAALNVARMEAQVSGGSGSSRSKKAQPDTSKYIEELKNAQAKQMKYLTIIAMIFGVGFLGYSFIKKKED